MAQIAGPIRRIAWLSSSDGPQQLQAEFVIGLREAGWTQGENLVLDLRFTEGDPARIAPLTTELLALKPNVFVASTDALARSAAQANKSLPIVFIVGFDPVGTGLVKSLAAPGGNATGFSVLNYELNPKRLALLKEAMPRLDKVAVLYRDRDEVALTALLRTEQAGRDLGLEMVRASFKRPEDLRLVFQRLAVSSVKALINVPDPMLINMRRQLADLAIEHHLAASFGATEYADAGMLMAYATDYVSIVRRATVLVDRLLKGAAPADIPVEQANAYELVLNLRTARVLGIEFPRSVLLQATRIIE
jgi:putative ABC transport system substrate-binding protein